MSTQKVHSRCRAARDAQIREELRNNKEHIEKKKERYKKKKEELKKEKLYV